MPTREPVKLTKRAVDALSVESGDTVVWDRDCRASASASTPPAARSGASRRAALPAGRSASRSGATAT